MSELLRFYTLSHLDELRLWGQRGPQGFSGPGRGLVFSESWDTQLCLLISLLPDSLCSQTLAEGADAGAER